MFGNSQELYVFFLTLSFSNNTTIYIYIFLSVAVIQYMYNIYAIFHSLLDKKTKLLQFD